MSTEENTYYSKHKKPRIKYKKICPCCNKEFKTSNNRKIYCSYKCGSRHNYLTHKKEHNKKMCKYHKERYKPKEKVKRICPICGKEFYKKSTAIYCSQSCWSKQNYINNKPLIFKDVKDYRIKHKTKILQREKKYRQTKKYKTRMNAYFKERRKEPLFKLRQNMSIALNQSMKKNKNINCKKPIFSFTKEEIYTHLNKTIPKGYTWKDYLNGTLQIDHMIAISWFLDEETFFKIGWNINNLTLLTKEENLLKSNTYAVINNQVFFNLEDALNEFIQVYHVAL